MGRGMAQAAGCGYRGRRNQQCRRRAPVRILPFAGTIRIRFKGFALSPTRGTPSFATRSVRTLRGKRKPEGTSALPQFRSIQRPRRPSSAVRSRVPALWRTWRWGRVGGCPRWTYRHRIAPPVVVSAGSEEKPSLITTQVSTHGQNAHPSSVPLQPAVAQS